MTRRVGLSMLLAALVFAGGCSSGYMVRGRAVRGAWVDAVFVTPDDEQLVGGVGVDGVKVALFRDPGTPNRSEVASARTRRGGIIELEFSAFGAGWMDEDWELVVTGSGYETVQVPLRLPRPGSKRQLLVTVVPGVSVPPNEPEDLWDQVEQFRR